MYILGIFYDGPDPSAALLKDGNIIAFVEEERLIRIKHATDYFPYQSIDYCLKKANISISEVDYITYGWDCAKYSNGFMKDFFAGSNAEFQVDSRTLSWQNRLLGFFNEDSQRNNICYHLRKAYGDCELPQIKFIPHHYSHAVSAFLSSPFERALVLTVDGSGDENCTVIWEGNGDKITPIRKFDIPHSLGWYYAAFTEYLGFRAYNGEYKVMGLAAYGKHNEKLISKVKEVLSWDENGNYTVNPYYIFYGDHTYSERFTDKLITLFDSAPRINTSDLTEWHKDLAFAVQYCLEQVVVSLAEYYLKETGLENICIGGGVGLNVKMNERIHESSSVNGIFIQPICSDTGTSIGSALALNHELTGTHPGVMKHIYFGPEYSNEEIEKTLSLCKVPYKKLKNIETEVADLISQGKVVGWFQGRMEGGPRALGARSILADPRKVESKDRVNAIIKFRENWRPFCPSILEEDGTKYLVDPSNAEFMVMGFKTNQENSKKIPAVVHVDNTVRVQLVSEENSPKYYRLLSAFRDITDVGVLLNTSFNIKGEPIVCTPQDALRTFFATGLDALAIGDFLVVK